ncbi:MAG: Glu-tRNA(Gln) amidotransferase subunit GatD [Thaumarchaeota archaeon]|jgi:glutamyl-tRNA(Gln) amidotransferase subunit D|nr:Glu-tRNA(Gln) amidotransferase subunit GatD [Nitrososphaerota archaeon]MBT4057317.1 Glu-tRNA(Gln) amidotransferase subunit GatD [Nitrososphaerota archaeon]MBT4176572.1 Glu-tRNA(Gln) amidotransferase subunit GatD [Nitrososphaerota archaeon]MBT4509405.1 Glu-tRNA(Gln) amidotransferase subunit GatD [Nitrososphaerota archaeon]MBT4973768.1 Glu-tRNA(Gln) amidotransferase subunit GatD [Nitrososphaerota archaeon]
MSELKGYKGKIRDFLISNKVDVGDLVKITSELTYSGILMPRYESGDESHIVLKLKSGYNIGIKFEKIEKLEKIGERQPNNENSQTIVKNEELPKILLLSTGGTIASKVDYRTGAVTPALSATELYEAVPEIAKIANVDAEVLFSEYSENLQPEHWLEIAKKIDSVVDSDYAGIIIAHGTDTMHYSSAFLSFALSGFKKPITLVGSQRSSDRPSSDAALNLIAATKFLVNTKSKGVFVVMHQNESDDAIACHLGTRVRKNHTSKRSAFQTVGSEPAFVMYENEILENMKNTFFKENEYNPRINLDTKVALIKYHPGFNPEIIDSLIKLEYRGIIFEGTGLGHVGRTMYDSIKKAKENGIFLGMTSQCIDGRVSMTVYESGRDLLDMGIIPLENMIPEVALVKAMWVLGNCNSEDDIKNMMLENYSSEF